MAGTWLRKGLLVFKPSYKRTEDFFFLRWKTHFHFPSSLSSYQDNQLLLGMFSVLATAHMFLHSEGPSAGTAFVSPLTGSIDFQSLLFVAVEYFLVNARPH